MDQFSCPSNYKLNNLQIINRFSQCEKKILKTNFSWNIILIQILIFLVL